MLRTEFNTSNLRDKIEYNNLIKLILQFNDHFSVVVQAIARIKAPLIENCKHIRQITYK